MRTWEIVNNDGVWLRSRREIAKAFSDNFSQLFAPALTSTISQVPFSSYLCHHFSDLDKHDMRIIPDWHEIKVTIFNMGSLKAPGPDGFPALFFKKFWHIVSEDVISVVRSFFISGKMPTNLNDTNLVLIPKNESPENISHFRPIALCNVVYKVISKILANRVKPFLNSLVCPTQTAFVPNRSIHDNSVIVQEILHKMKRKSGKGGLMVIKIDLGI